MTDSPVEMGARGRKGAAGGVRNPGQEAPGAPGVVGHASCPISLCWHRSAAGSLALALVAKGPLGQCASLFKASADGDR